MQCQELCPPIPCKVHLPSLLISVIAVLLVALALFFAPPAVACDEARMSIRSADPPAIGGTWPPQALSHKVGELKLLALRQRAQQALGSRFDPHAFHDEVLAGSALPLSTLESRIDSWIVQQKKVAVQQARLEDRQVVVAMGRR